VKSQVIMEPVRISQKLMSDPGVDPAFVDQAIGYVLSQIDRNLQSFTRLFPASASKQLVYPACENIDWTTGF
jgi:unsaturated chondroitin disaccharide hydrolase